MTSKLSSHCRCPTVKHLVQANSEAGEPAGADAGGCERQQEPAVP